MPAKKPPNRKQIPTKPLYTRQPVELYDALAAEADKTRRTITQQLAEILRDRYLGDSA